MRSVPITESIDWVGAIDWDLRDFHGYDTPLGTTYNAYVVRGSEKTALVDTVKVPFVPELLARIAHVVDPSDIDLIVVNHVEPDHNGGLPLVAEACPDAEIVASGSGVRAVAAYHDGFEVRGLAKDEVIDLGGLTLRFLPMPMVHWPDSMFTWCEERRTLMPNDAFGQHLASSERFADEIGASVALEAAEVYFANILMPLTKQVGKAVEKVVEAGWAPEIIAPSHGVAWRDDDVSALLDSYGGWVSGETTERVTIAFSTMWESTRELAHAIADGVAQEGVDCRVFDLAGSPHAEIAHHLLSSRALLLGSPTLHHGMLYRASGFLTYLEGLKPAGKLGGVFGSFGWGGGAAEAMRERMEAIGLEMIEEDLTVRFRPTAEDLDAACGWGKDVAVAVRERGA
jgi:anaerobic nitric oxide reductase flavorubredoxin